MTTKKIFAAAFAALFMTAFNACTKEETPAAPEVPGIDETLVEMTITAVQTADDSAAEPEIEPSQTAVKSTFDGTQVGWETDDLVAIYDGTAKRQFTVVSVENGVATLKGMVSPDATEFYAVFPYSAAGDALPAQDGQVSLNMPSVQTLAEDKNFDENAMVTVGKVQNGNVVLKNAVSLLKLHIPEGVASVRLQGFAYENIAGGVSVSADAVAGAAASSSVTLKPAGETFVAGTHYVALLPVKFAAGFKVVYSKEGQIAVIKTTEEVEFKRKDGFDVTASAANLTWLANPIMTEDQLLTYVANQGAYAGETAKLGADITLTKAWTPVSLTGIIDGQQHTVSGLSVSATGDKAGMFSVVETDAALKNITVEGSITQTATAGTSYAGLVAEVKGTMYKVINKASVNVTSTGTTRTYVGGLAGRISAGSSLLECQNSGSVTLSSSAAPSFLGGVAGYMAGGLVQKSSNNATVTSQSSKAEGLGGIVGLQQGGKLDICTNGGTLVPTAAAANSYVGGITGYVQNQTKVLLTINECVNEGEITFTNVLKAAGGIVGVIHRYCSASSEIVGCVNDKELSVEIEQAEFYLGGIVGRMANPGSASAIGKHVNYIKNCTNKKTVSLTKTTTTSTTSLKIGGISGIVLGEVSISGNSNLAETVSMSDAGAVNLVSMVGGICGHTDSDPVTFSGNINKADVIASTVKKDVEILAGGLLGYVKGNLASTGNINFGDVSSVNGSGSTSNAYAGGIVGTFRMSAGNTAELTEDKTFGHISSSSARAGLLIGTSRYDGYGTITAKDCVVGGKLTDPLNKYNLEITATNFDDDNKMLISYYKAAYATFSSTGLKFGVAADYDK